ncbi:bifunctional phosphopantothenoylcysteine decarboxylase/phosphopantothenate--cysteine ligase CoaBC [Alkalihalophilus marmarensis]|jgi:phosphopantothenoylcysteine decarboxylase/phosphopantothenate--cysteine ligase|uniref:Coenzyme A biosynthesis bifunctional protein CoaBC n=1 Tax=Alkalihalophilus marmarensis DSM 21297 TaxID=1188261 RepID=U6SN75_9BACI|nr:bifunctional phosphopantothenoylcysteine decarboxylase/phosphopantothenate--cysteine ligase CoaBC [Alkalihalophilus marmarensis]ERN53189.1 peptidase ClpP [Alkalihalophilus marmarensis DSM 21297]MCM3489635.1 bifunctional phosphopantothenoylcysteine decarboxylase/phosphopantothenate--cysteine ligase CoaBC [Alkalihalophilus marmarensis]
MVNGKHIVLAVTGGIAAYKACALTSKLVQAGADVKVMMSDSAKEFVNPNTFQALSKNPVYDWTFHEPDPSKIAHIDLADWADLVIVAPATANVIGKLANGIADDMITTTLLATKADVYLAPAMNVNMYNHPAVQKNMQTLKDFGYSFIEGEAGYLACGWTGKGRMAEPEVIADMINRVFEERDTNSINELKGKHVVITAGPTQERIDPVRYFTNHSTGKMGYAIAAAAKRAGAEVTLVSGPTNLPRPAGVDVIKVISAEEMYQAVMSVYNSADIVIKSAAVADYRPKETFEQKRKKSPGEWSVEMERTRDILKTLGEKKANQILVGFAAESENVEEYAKQKLLKKNLDLIVANNITTPGAGFGSDTNIVTILSKDGEVKNYEQQSKDAVAKQILTDIIDYIERNRNE